MVNENAWLVLAPFASVTSTVKLDVPVAVGIPLICPVPEFSYKPAGRGPAVAAKLQVSGGVPPLTAMNLE
jgi:hypothetical protein